MLSLKAGDVILSHKNTKFSWKVTSVSGFVAKIHNTSIGWQGDLDLRDKINRIVKTPISMFQYEVYGIEAWKKYVRK